jgi:hypothetical protein
MLPQEKHRVKWEIKRQRAKNKIIGMINTVKEKGMLKQF